MYLSSRTCQHWAPGGGDLLRVASSLLILPLRARAMTATQLEVLYLLSVICASKLRDVCKYTFIGYN